MKAIIAIALCVFIIGGTIYLKIKEKKKGSSVRHKSLRFFIGGTYGKSKDS